MTTLERENQILRVQLNQAHTALSQYHEKLVAHEEVLLYALERFSLHYPSVYLFRSITEFRKRAHLALGIKDSQITSEELKVAPYATGFEVQK